MPAEDAYDQIKNLGSMLDHYEQREILLRLGLGANLDKKAEYVVTTGSYLLMPPLTKKIMRSIAVFKESVSIDGCIK
jgi:hypothetical protein